MDPKVGDNVQYEGRVGTVVSRHEDDTQEMRWVVIAFDGVPGHAPTKVWLGWRDWWRLRTPQ